MASTEDFMQFVHFRGLNLYDYQVETLKRLIEAEEAHIHQGAECRIPLTEPFGAGKTFIILAHIMANPIPKKPPRGIPLVPPISFIPSTFAEDYYARIQPNVLNQVTRPTAIVVARSVYAQWVRNIETYTCLRFFEARDKITVAKLIKAMLDGSINDYDIVLIKYGQTKEMLGTKTKKKKRTRARASPTGEEGAAAAGTSAEAGDDKWDDQQTFTKIELCSIINNETVPLFWSRVVYDDVDLMSNSPCMRALSSVFVTGATSFRVPGGSEVTKIKQKAKILAKCTPAEFICGTFDFSAIFTKIPPIKHIFRPTIWATNGHTAASIASQTKIFAISWLSARISNTEIFRASKLIGSIEASDCDELLRMMNGDAMVSAAKMLHISVITPNAMFASVLGAQKEDYVTAHARVQVFTTLCSIPREKRVIRASETETRDIVIEKMFNEFGLPKNVRDIAERPIEKLDETIRAEACLAWDNEEFAVRLSATRAFLTRLERSFVRIKENLSTQTCGICYIELESCDIVIMRCCGYIMCSECCSRGSHFVKKDNDVVGCCVQCRQAVSVKGGGIILVESGGNVASLIDQASKSVDGEISARAGTSASASDRAATSADASERAPMRECKSKTDYVLAIIRGDFKPPYVNSPSKTVTITKDAPQDIVGVVVGTQYLPASDDNRMVIVCASFDETISDISVALTENGIGHRALSGSVHEFATAIDDFMGKKVRVIIINTRALFAGVDLQCATDIILLDSYSIENVGQIIGRAQRLGRTCSLTVHSLTYVGSAQEKSHK